MLKTHETMQDANVNLNRYLKLVKKDVSTNENSILRNMVLKFPNPNFNILCKIAFWNKQKWLTKELILWSGLPR